MLTTEETIEKAEKTLESVDIRWSPETAAIAGVGYSILTLAKALLKKKNFDKKD